MARSYGVVGRVVPVICGESVGTKLRIGIVGAGIAGLSCAWLLEEVGHDVVLFERETYAGGHAHTQRVEHAGAVVHVDTACSTLTAATHPLFLKFLDLLGVGVDRGIGTVAAYSRERGRNLFVIPSRDRRQLVDALRFSSLQQLLRLNRAINAAIKLEKADDWSVSVREFVDGLPTKEIRALMLPLLVGILGTSQREACDFSARAGMKFLVFPRLGATPFSLERISILGGMTTYVQALLNAPHSFELRLDCEIKSVDRQGTQFRVRDSRGADELVDEVVLATPAYLTNQLIATLPGSQPVRDALDCMEYYETEIYVHSDTEWMPKSRSSWSYVNFMVGEGGESVKSFWCGADTDADVFRSWGAVGSNQPRNVHGHYRYMHPRMTPNYFRAQSRINALSPELYSGGLWLAGSYLEDIDTHESGLRSAINVVSRLAPASKNLRRLRGPAPHDDTPKKPFVHVDLPA